MLFYSFSGLFVISPPNSVWLHLTAPMSALILFGMPMMPFLFFLYVFLNYLLAGVYVTYVAVYFKTLKQRARNNLLT